MTEMDLARMSAHRANLARYRSLLATQLTDVERAFIHRRIAQERDALDGLIGRTRGGPTTPRLAVAGGVPVG